MKAGVTIFILIASITMPLWASYSLAMPASASERLAVISSDGDTIELDSTVWYMRWNGLRLEQMAEDIYRIEDTDGTAVLAAGCAASIRDIEDVLDHSAYGIGSLILAGGMPEIGVLEDSGIMSVYTAERIDDRARLVLERRGITAERFGKGAVLGIEDGHPLIEPRLREVHIRCPECGAPFSIFV